MLKSFITAFQMYSKIPMPNIEWKPENRKYSLGFFPFIGVIIGLVLILWRMICDKLCIGQSLFSAAAVCIPVMISGGIHLDGFCDVTDAVHSYGDKKKKLEIMSDPHIGSFAMIYSVLYFLLQFGLFTQADTLSKTVIISLEFVLSRVLSSFSVIFLKPAKEKSSLSFFTRPLEKRITVIMEIIYVVLCFTVFFYLSPLTAAAAAAALSAAFILFRKMSNDSFGGITGDLCGWFLQVTELLFLAVVIVSSKLIEVFL